MSRTTLLDEDRGSCYAAGHIGCNEDHNYHDVRVRMKMVGRQIVDRVPPRNVGVYRVSRTCTDLALDLVHTSHSWAFVVVLAVAVVNVEEEKEDTASSGPAYVKIRMKRVVVLDHRVVDVCMNRLGSTVQIEGLVASLTEATKTKTKRKASVGRVIAPSANGVCSLLSYVLHSVQLA